MTKRQYEIPGLTVYWNSDLCIHCGECHTGLSEVFDPERRPWVDLSKATPNKITEQVKQCPSKALSLEPN